MSPQDYRRIAIVILVLGSIAVVPFFLIVGLGRDAARKRRLLAPFAFVYAALVGGLTYAALRSVDAPALALAALGGFVAFYLIWTLTICSRCSAATPRRRIRAAPERCRSCGAPLASEPRA